MIGDIRSRNVNKLWGAKGKMGSQDKIALGIHPGLGRMCTSGGRPRGEQH